MYEQPELGFEFDALEPHMDEATLKVHYGKHHTTYVKKFNDAVEGTEFSEKDLGEILRNLDTIPQDIKLAVINHGGGALNHSFFWRCLIPTKEFKEIDGKIKAAIEEKFKSFEEFKKQFSDAAATVFGSGWAWLVKGEDGLEIIKTSNQGSPLSIGKVPLLVIDVWEHAYYLKYKNLRPDYIEAFFNIINWEQVEKNFLTE
tara:strand:- start:1812 stop:2414 length:603 start_codon:yes stop_codon:yes gene_type:complete